MPTPIIGESSVLTRFVNGSAGALIIVDSGPLLSAKMIKAELEMTGTKLPVFLYQ